MAYFDRKNPAENQIFSPIANALRTIFGRSVTQVAQLKGQDLEQDAYNRPDSIEKQLAKIFSGYTDIQYDRVTKYRDYDRMDISSTECQTALDIYAEEASQPDSKTGMKAWVESEDQKMADELNGMFKRIRMEHKVWGIYRNIAKYGDCFEYMMLSPYGIHDMQFIHPSRVERVQEDGLQGFKCPDLTGVVPMDNRVGLFKPWDFIHFRVMAYDQESVYGRSFLESLRKVWKQLSMLETMIVIFRISKAVQRNIFYVDVGQASIQETAELVKQYEKFLKTKSQFVDSATKDFKMDFNPATILQDIVWPVRPGSASKVDHLENTANIGPLTDLEAFRSKMRIGLGIPKDFFDGEVSGAWNSKEALILQDARFSRKIERIQNSLRDGLIRMCQIHWAITHQLYLDPDAFQVKLGTISDSAERIREDILLRKAQILEILGNLSVTMGWNRKVWTDYLLDEVYPLPKKLRDDLNTPDPVEMEMMMAAAGGGKPGEGGGGKKPGLGGKLSVMGGTMKKTKPPKKVTADNLQKGLRAFGYGKAESETIDDLTPQLMEEFVDETEQQDALEAIAETILSPFFGLTKEEIDVIISAPKDTTVPQGMSGWKKLQELGIAPGSLEEGQSYEKETSKDFKSPLNDIS